MFTLQTDMRMITSQYLTMTLHSHTAGIEQPLALSSQWKITHHARINKTLKTKYPYFLL